MSEHDLDPLAARPGGRPAWKSVRAELEARGFRPSQRFGQNFLLDDNVLRAIVRDADLAPGARVLEVGPGCGFLTLHLLRAGFEVVCVEIDPRLAEIARSLLAGERAFELVVADVLDGKHALSAEIAARLPASEPWHVVANLPYSAGGPLLAVLAGLENPPKSATVLIQREVAQRLAAAPGTREFGPLTLAVQWLWNVEMGRSVSADLFWPRPNVESSVVHLRPRADAAPREGRLAAAELARALLGRRRQTILRVLGDVAGGRERAQAVLHKLGVSPSSRAEELAPDVWLDLASELGPTGLPEDRASG